MIGGLKGRVKLFKSFVDGCFESLKLRQGGWNRILNEFFCSFIFFFRRRRRAFGKARSFAGYGRGIDFGNARYFDLGHLSGFDDSFLGHHDDNMSSRERSLKLYRLEREGRDGCGWMWKTESCWTKNLSNPQGNRWAWEIDSHWPRDYFNPYTSSSLIGCRHLRFSDWPPPGHRKIQSSRQQRPHVVGIARDCWHQGLLLLTSGLIVADAEDCCRYRGLLRCWGLLQISGVVADVECSRGYCRYKRVIADTGRLSQIPNVIADAEDCCRYRGLLLSSEIVADVECCCWHRELLQIQGVIADIGDYCWCWGLL